MSNDKYKVGLSQILPLRYLFVMRDLIRKILLEYSTSELLLEGKATVEVPPKVNSVVESYLNKINNNGKGFYGYFFDSSDKVISRFFYLEVTKHYKQRLFRTEEPEYQPNGGLYNPLIVNPEPLEGLELISKNANLIAELIYNNRIKTEGQYITFFTKDDVPYSVIAVVNRDPLKPKKIVIKLITQIKGVRFSRRFTEITTQQSIELPREDNSRISSIMSRLIESILKKIGLII